MMEIELPKMQPSQQDMELIDILWRQDVDLGAGREVFDFSYRQKEVELRRQREQEEEKRQQNLREQQKALLAQLQLDEETGEFVPRASPASLTQANTTNAQITQNGPFAGETHSMSFDECMQLLAETFPLDEPAEPASACLDASVPPSTDLMMPPDMSALTQNPLLPDSLDQAWMELLSLPELQQCLNMQMQETLDVDGFINTSPSGEAQDTNYSPYLPGMDHLSSSHAEACPPEYINTYDGSFNTMVSPNLSQMNLNGPDVGTKFGSDEFCELFYPEMEVKGNSGLLTSDDANMVEGLAEIPTDPPVNPMDLHSFSPGNFSSGKPEPIAEFPDSDSGLDTSPNISSPEKSLHGDGSFSFSDSDSDEMDGSPGSADSDYTEIFPLVYHSDGAQVLFSDNPPAESQEMKMKNPKIEPAEASGHSKPPFTKDKAKKRSEARLSRDEQRAKALKIPFTVDMMINLPVDDFNEMMSKHQLSEPQLSLIRDIRRRGKNKVAAQNCRKRKLENIVGLEYELDSLKEEKERLMKEKSQRSASLREMKQELNTLYQEVFSMLRDEQGRPFSPNEFSLQHTADGTVFLVPRLKKNLVKNN